MEFIQHLFSTEGFMPHGDCYMWNPALIWLHVISDGLIALAYYSIPLTLVYFVRRRKDLVFDWIFLCFAAFIVACGTTHLMEIYNIWHPTYWLSGCIKAITAIFSVFTAILLVRLVPLALALPSPAQLRLSNEALQREVTDRTAAVDLAEALNRELRAQTASLKAANEELEAFGHSVSHDLRSPLRNVGGYIELLRQDSPEVSDAQQGYLKKITESVSRMGVLVDSLLEFSRMGKAALRLAPVDTAVLIDEVRQELFAELATRKIAWKIDPLPTVCADRNLLAQVWVNLLSNAVKYTARRLEAEISVTCRETDAEFEFCVRDNGAGFDMREADKLFGIFQRLHSKKDFEGTGIGLANVRRIVSRHGGRTWAEAEIDRGAAFFFTLPKTSSIVTPTLVGAPLAAASA